MRFVLILVMQVIGFPEPFTSKLNAEDAGECQQMGEMFKRRADSATTRVSWLCVERLQK